jgi:hypothetical protein
MRASSVADLDRDRLLADLNRRLNFLRLKFVATLDAVRYKLALDWQVEIEDLQCQRSHLTPHRRHLYLMEQAASAAATGVLPSHRSRSTGELVFFEPAPLPEGPTHARRGRRPRR